VELGLPEPTITEIGMRVRFSVPLLESITVGIVKRSTEQVSEQVGAPVSEQVWSLLQACSGPSKSRQALLSSVGLSNAYLNYKRHIAPLLEQGLLEMTVPDKPNSRLQNYRLTEQGRQALARHRP
jgi:hypothetical protein